MVTPGRPRWAPRPGTTSHRTCGRGTPRTARFKAPVQAVDDAHRREAGDLRPIEEMLEARQSFAHPHAHEVELARGVVGVGMARRHGLLRRRRLGHTPADVRQRDLERQRPTAEPRRLALDLDELATDARPPHLDAVAGQRKPRRRRASGSAISAARLAIAAAAFRENSGQRPRRFWLAATDDLERRSPFSLEVAHEGARLRRARRSNAGGGGPRARRPARRAQPRARPAPGAPP